MSNTALVYMSGAGLQSFIWDEVSNGVNMPYKVITYAHKPLTLGGYVEEALHQITELGDKKVILIAHSISGVIAVEVAKRLGSQIIGFIAVSAVIPKPSRSFVTSLPFPQKLIMPIILKVAGTRPPESSIRSSLAKDLSDEQQSQIVNDFTPEAKRLYTDKTSADPLNNVKSLYVITTKDTEFTASYQALQAKNIPGMQSAYIKSGHLPMISHSRELTQLIAKFIGQ